MLSHIHTEPWKVKALWETPLVTRVSGDLIGVSFLFKPGMCLFLLSLPCRCSTVDSSVTSWAPQGLWKEIQVQTSRPQTSCSNVNALKQGEIWTQLKGMSPHSLITGLYCMTGKVRHLHRKCGSIYLIITEKNGFRYHCFDIRRHLGETCNLT